MAITPRNAARSVVSSDAAKLRSETAPGPNRSCHDSTPLGLSNRFSVIQLFSRRVMEDDTERVTVPRANAAYAVSKIDPIHTARTLHRTVMDGEDNRITLPERHDFWPRLHARALFG